MRKSISYLVTIISTMLIVFGLFSCNMDVGVKTPENETKATGKITGKVMYSNVEGDAHNGIILTLDKTDGLVTQNVMNVMQGRVQTVDTFQSAAANARSIVANNVTSSDGSYTFENLEAGIYTVYAASSYSAEKAVCTNVVVRAAETTVADVLKLTATGSISGKITLDNGRSGNTGFLVFVAGTSYMAMTDDAGNYTISGVPAGSGYQVVATKNGVIHNLSNNVQVSANRTTAMANNNFTTNELESNLKGEQGIQGIQGEKGLDGVSFKWLGAFDSADEIIDPKYLDAYFNTTNGCSYIWDGEEWTLLARSGRDGFIEVGEGIGEESRNILAIGTLLSTEEITNQSVEITVNLTKSGLQKKGYVYSVEEPAFANADDVLNNSEFVSIKKDSDGKYKIIAEENGYYTIAVKDTEDEVSFTQERITNIDKTAPDKVTELRAKYDIDSEKLTVTWINPADSDFAYADFSYTKNGILQIDKEQITNETYLIKNVRADGSKYIFTLYAVDQAGNKSDVTTISITPKGYSVGDVLLNDGTILPYGTNFTYAQRQSAVGVCYAIDLYGKPKGWLGIYNSASDGSKYYWEKFRGVNKNKSFPGIACSTTYKGKATYGDTKYYTAPFSGDIDGSDNWEYISSMGYSKSIEEFPIFNYAKNYASRAGLNGNYADGWYVPSIAELYDIFKNKDRINSVLIAIGGIPLLDTEEKSTYGTYEYGYWSSSQHTTVSGAIYNGYAWSLKFSDGIIYSEYKSNNTLYVCCIRKYR